MARTPTFIDDGRLICTYCGYTWAPDKDEPKQCPACNGQQRYPAATKPLLAALLAVPNDYKLA